MKTVTDKIAEAVMGRSVFVLLVLVAVVCRAQGQEYNVTDCPLTCVCERPPHVSGWALSNWLYIRGCSSDPYPGLLGIFQTYPTLDGLRISHSLNHTAGKEGYMARLLTEMGRLTSLKVLGMSYNNLTELPDTIGNLSSLESLYVYNNHLSILPDTIGQLSSLQRLDVSYNHLITLPDAVGQLSLLEELDLDNNRLTSLPDAVGQLSSLKVLDIDNNRLATLSDALGQLSSLQLMHVNNNNIAMLPDTIGQLSSLQILSVNENQLTTLPASVGQLSSLSWLYIDNNRLNSLPDEVWQLSSLQLLHVNNNNLTILPDSLGQLSSLQILAVNDNQLSSLPDSLGDLSSLQILSVNNNQLTTLPGSLGQLSSLEKLYVNHNPLTTLPDAVWQLSFLWVLDISNNQLTVVDMSVILSVPHRVVALNNNQISALGTIPTTEPDFENLDLSNNNLTMLDSWFFKLGVSAAEKERYSDNIYNVRSLDVSNNSISSITNHRGYTTMPETNDRVGCNVDLSYNSIQHLHTITEGLNITQPDLVHLLISEQLDLGGNPLDCDCVDYNMYQELKLDPKPPSLICGAPTALRGLSIADVGLDKFICNVTENCPSGCFCSETPYNKSLNIYCTEYKGQNLPLQVPMIKDSSYGYLVNFDGGSLENLSDRSYISDTISASFRNNQIHYISPNFFNGTNLRFIDLRNNLLKVVDAWPLRLIFQQHEAWINLDHNSISKFTNDIRYNPEADSTRFHHKDLDNIMLSLNNNSITHFSSISIPWGLSMEIFEDIVEEDILKLAHNPLVCDCQDYEFYRNIHHKHNITCAKPAKLKGKLISEIRLDQFTCTIEADCPHGCVCTDIPSRGVLSVHCYNYTATTLPLNLPRPWRNTSDFKYSLHFENGSLTTLEGRRYLENVENASFSENTIRDIKHGFFKILKLVNVLKLDHNHIKMLPFYIVNRPKSKIYLGNNKWECSCNNHFTIKWIQENKDEVADYENVSCYGPDTFKNKRFDNVSDIICSRLHEAYIIENNKTVIIEKNETVIEKNEPVIIEKNHPALIVMCILLVLVILVAIFAYVRRVWIYKTFKWHPFNWGETDEADKEFDVFISYADEDQDYILDYLIPRLEEAGYYLCHHHVNFVPGRSIIWNIHRAIMRSKRTLAFCSQAYIDCGMCQHEFYTALTLQIKEKCCHLVTIKDTDLDINTLDIDAQSYFQRYTYIRRESTNFWENLHYVLPVNRTNASVAAANVSVAAEDLPAADLGNGYVNE